MANLTSPGVTVNVIDESFFIPGNAGTTPLFFLATAAEKTQPDGVTPAAGTFESNVIRTVTSLRQSTQLYGVPAFYEDESGNPLHGDARNEYGVFALNQFLGIGNRAYVLRADVNLDDNITSIRALWDNKAQEAAFVLENLVANQIATFNVTNGLNSLVDITAASSLGELVSGTGYTPGTYINVPLVGGTGSGATATVVVTASGIDALSIAVGGTGYVDGTYMNIELTGGTGAGATAHIDVLGGIVVSATIAAGGTGYVALDSLAVDAADLGGSGAGVDLTVDSVDGTVLSVSIEDGGLGYTVSDALTASAANLGGGGSGFQIAVVGVGDLLSPISTVPAESTMAIVGLKDLVDTATLDLWEFYNFRNSESNFMDDITGAPASVFPNGYDNPAVGEFIGFDGVVADWLAGLSGSVVGNEFTPAEASSLFLQMADSFKFTTVFRDETRLGANDADRRVAIVEALQATINANTDIRSELFEYNIVLCPGIHEVVDEMINLVVDINEEALVLADTPMGLDPDETATWGGTSARRTSRNVAYYYPPALASNLDGRDVTVAATGMAMRTIAFSDEVAEPWFAPAGTRRGLVSGVSQVGYIEGMPGSATTFTEVALNVGQRDNLYKYFTNINPIVFFPGRGIVVWGQKTSAPDASALDRINVVRLVAHIKRSLRKNTLSFVFQPNDQITRDSLKATVDAFLGNLIVKRGLYDFATIVDESNNTPDVIDRNELLVDIAIKPVKSAEFITINLRILNTGAQL